MNLDAVPTDALAVEFLPVVMGIPCADSFKILPGELQQRILVSARTSDSPTGTIPPRSDAPDPMVKRTLLKNIRPLSAPSDALPLISN